MMLESAPERVVRTPTMLSVARAAAIKILRVLMLIPLYQTMFVEYDIELGTPSVLRALVRPAHDWLGVK